MPTLLRLDSSADLDASRTRALTQAFTDAWTALGDDHTVVTRDLHRDPIPHLEHWALHLPADQHPEGLELPADAVALQQQVLAELFDADVVLVGVPVYNFSLPSTLKAWVDRVHVPGVTFAGPQPLAGRPVVLATASGLAYDAGTPTESWEHAVAALRVVFGESFGMPVHTVQVRYTEADPVEENALRARTDLEAGLVAIRNLAAELG